MYFLGRNIRKQIKSYDDLIYIFNLVKTLNINFFQIFLDEMTNSLISELELKNFGNILKNEHIYFVIHSRFTINFCGKDSTYINSCISLINDINIANIIGNNCYGVILHLGKNTVGYRKKEAIIKYIEGINYCLNKTNCNIPIIIENGVGLINEISSNIKTMKLIYKNINHRNRLKFCLDTCHIWVNGLNINVKKVIDSYLTDFNNKIGLENLIIIHLNNAQYEMNSHIDKHSMISSGYINPKRLFYLVKYIYKINNNVGIVLETNPGNTTDDFKNELDYVKMNL